MALDVELHETEPEGRGIRQRIAAAMASSKYQWALVWVLLAMLASFRSAVPAERDPLWSARAGWENLTGQTPLAPLDTWSWLRPGERWYPNSPAWNWVLGVAYHFLGYWGLYLVTFASLMTLFGLAWLLAVRLGARPLPGFLGMMVPLILAGPMESARATVVVQSLFLLSILAMVWVGNRVVNSRRKGLTSWLVLAILTPLFVAGNWLHLSFLVFGWALALLFAVMWWFTPGLRTIDRVGMGLQGLAAAGLGVLWSPYGWQLGMERSRAVYDACAGLILEWMAVWQVNFFQWWFLGLVTLLFAAGSAVWIVRWLLRRGPFDDRFRIAASLVALALPTAIAGMAMIRFLGVSVIVLVPIAAYAMTKLADRAHVVHATAKPGTIAASKRFGEYTSAKLWTVVLTGVALVFVPVTVAFASLGSVPPENAVLSELPRGCVLLADGGISDASILARPDIKVMLDGRADFYGHRSLVEQVNWLMARTPIPDEVNCVALKTTGGFQTQSIFPLAKKMPTLPGWKEIAHENGYTAWVRD